MAGLGFPSCNTECPLPYNSQWYPMMFAGFNLVRRAKWQLFSAFMMTARRDIFIDRSGIGVLFWTNTASNFIIISYRKMWSGFVNALKSCRFALRTKFKPTNIIGYHCELCGMGILCCKTGSRDHFFLNKYIRLHTSSSVYWGGCRHSTWPPNETTARITVELLVNILLNCVDDIPVLRQKKAATTS